MGAMATHTIMFPDYSRGDEPRAIVWDDETGEVSGDNVEVPSIRRRVERAARDGHILDEAGRIDVRDPRHDPADFLAVFRYEIGGTFKFERVDLPPALRGVKPTQGWRPDLPPGTVA